MKHLQPVIWSKGTFLTPQHLQVQDLYFESTLQFRLSALSSFAWGFTALGIDPEALTAGEFKLTHASGMLPDGLLFDIPHSDRAPKARNVAEFFEKDKDALEVYLAIPGYRERGINVSSNNDSAATRYDAEVRFFRDENTGLSEKPVQVARKNFSFLFEGENRQGSSTLRIARVKRTAAGAFQLDPRFAPPLLDFAANDQLTAIARRLTETLSSKSRELAEARREKNQILADFTVADIPNFWLLYTVNSFLPLIRHFFETKHGHPEPLFATMLSLAGSLTTFSPKVQPRDLPTYDHEDLSGCFTDLDEKLRFLLQAAPPTNIVSLPLTLAQPSIYTTNINEDRYLVNTKWYLAISAEMNEADLIRKSSELLKVCSANQIEQLVRHALTGMTLTHSRPSAIPVKLRHQYFALSLSGDCWESVKRARNFAAYVPGDFPNPQLELVIVLPTKT
jgi:type VI secretion system protein ImpJ